jgi:hypothetical protein
MIQGKQWQDDFPECLTQRQKNELFVPKEIGRLPTTGKFKELTKQNKVTIFF